MKPLPAGSGEVPGVPGLLQPGQQTRQARTTKASSAGQGPVAAPCHLRRMSSDRVRVGVSSCLLGEKVRFDGQHKRDAFVVDQLGKHVDWVAGLSRAGGRAWASRASRSG